MRVLAQLVAGVVLLGACSQQSANPADERARTPSPSSLGGPTPTRTPPPQVGMDSLERPVRARLAAQVSDQGLRLDHLACPPWDGSLPTQLTCRAYVDGLVVGVRVRLRASGEKDVEFDARLTEGVVSTHRIEQTLLARAWTRADCGEVDAYPSSVGSRIVCRVSRPGLRRYVVVRVRTPAGAVSITDWTGSQ